MTDAQNITNSRTDGDQPIPEPSPSAGWRKTAALMHVTPGLEECDVHGCDPEDEPLEVVDGDTEDARREDGWSPDHEKGIMEVYT